MGEMLQGLMQDDFQLTLNHIRRRMRSVNAGAEIVAGGDVVIWGSLRGMIHAGAGGDQAAVVCALLLAPTQLRIADLVSRGSEPSGPIAPEMARILDGRILVEPWSARRK